MHEEKPIKIAAAEIIKNCNKHKYNMSVAPVQCHWEYRQKRLDKNVHLILCNGMLPEHCVLILAPKVNGIRTLYGHVLGCDERARPHTRSPTSPSIASSVYFNEIKCAWHIVKVNKDIFTCPGKSIHWWNSSEEKAEILLAVKAFGVSKLELSNEPFY